MGIIPERAKFLQTVGVLEPVRVFIDKGLEEPRVNICPKELS